MKDIDFDELDRAVNSLMEGVSRDNSSSSGAGSSSGPAAASSTARSGSVSNLNRETELVIKPASGAALRSFGQSANSDSRPTPPASSRSASGRRSGRFMDVLHPSSDMTTPTPTSNQPSREGAYIQPSSTNTQAPTGQSVQATPEPLPANDNQARVSLDNQGVINDLSPSPVSDWPDPIDGLSAGQAAENDTAQVVASPASSNGRPDDPGISPDLPTPDSTQVDGGGDTVKDSASDAPDVASNVTNEDNEDMAMESPFIPGAGAKVEKRPLGKPALGSSDSINSSDGGDEGDEGLATSDAQSPPTVTTPPQATKSQRPGGSVEEDSQLPVDPRATNALPPELSSDLMAIESDSSLNAVDTEEVKPNPSTSMTSKPDITPAAPAAAATGSPSIAQQYEERPSTGDKQSGSIYDTHEYHKPLAHPDKKSSGWLWIVWILLLLLLGAGGGALVYLYVL